MRTDPKPTRPFKHVVSDLFTYAGRHYLVCVFRFSGFIVIADWNDDPTANQVDDRQAHESKAQHGMEEFAEAILELRNTPGVDGRSPNEIVFGTN